MSEIVLQVSEPDAVELEYVEARIKPEVVGHATPTYEQQTVNPVDGTTFGSFVVEPIPDPTAIKEISTNGDHDVARYGTARVDVQPTLQQKTVTPTEQQQTVEADSGYDALSRVVVEPIPSEYIVPQGKITLTENATGVDVKQYATADIAVPESPYAAMLSGVIDNTVENLVIPDGTKQIAIQKFSQCSSLKNIIIPNSVELIGHESFNECSGLLSIKIPGSVKSIYNRALYNCSSLTLIDCTELTQTNGVVNTTIGSQAMWLTNSAPIVFADEETMNVYKTATNWTDYQARMTYVGA